MNQSPHGEVIAGWWWRVGSYFVDSMLISAAAGLATWREQLDLRQTVLGDLQAWNLQAQMAVQHGDALPGIREYWPPIETRIVFLAIHHIPVAMAVSAVYFAIMLRWKSATLGHLACGLRVRRELRQPGPLPVTTIIVRVGVQFLLPGLLTLYGLYTQTRGSIDIALAMVVAYTTLDVVGALVNRRNQTLHDLAAETVVVRLASVSRG